MKIYTKTGDKGNTGVIGGRLDKDHSRVEAYGTIDELNTLVGMAITYLRDKQYTDIVETLNEIQQNLFDCCSDLATVDLKLREYQINTEHVENLETLIDRYDQETEDIDHFIIPGGSRTSAAIHACRTVTRRAERRVVALSQQENNLNQDVLTYLNRLSDLFFTIARACNARASVSDVFYLRSKKAFRKAK